MSDFILAADSGCDLSMEACKSKGIVPVCMKYIIDGQEYSDTMNFEDNKKFYDTMRSGKSPKTVQLNDFELTDFWEPFLSTGSDILHICMSSAISGTYRNCLRAAEKLMEKYPERTIRVVDSLMTSTGSGLIALECARMRDEGKSLDEIFTWAIENSLRVHACFSTDDITYLHRGGRVSYVGMILSKALRVFPVLWVNGNGELKVFAKARGRNACYEVMAKYITDNCENPAGQTLYVSGADNDTDAKTVGEEFKRRFGFRDVYYSQIGSIIGSHTGPGLITIFFLGKKRGQEAL